MEFWGVEVKGSQPLKVKPDQDTIIHLSQAALGEFKKGKGTEPVPLFVNFDEKKLVLGTLSSDNIPQLSFDLVFEKDFELSHNWKNGSVFFCGYQAPLPEDVGTNFSDYGDSEDEDLPLVNADNGKIEPKFENAKAAAGKAAAGKPESSTKPKANAVVPSKVKPEDGSDEDGDSDEDSDDSDDEDGSESDDFGSHPLGKIEPKVENAKAAAGKAAAGKPESSTKPKANAVVPSKVKPEDGDSDEDDDEDGSEGDDSDEEGMSLSDDDEDEDDYESEDEDTPKKVEQGKKRPNESVTKTPVPSKKAKVVTPRKTDSKKGGHSATPHPAKNAGKVAKPQTPKSGGQFSCKSCDRSFGSDVALQSHTKAKHEGK